MTLAIRDAVTSDAAAICRVYNPYIRNSIVTFEEAEVTVSEMAVRIAKVTGALPWLVAEEAGEFIGYAYAAMHRERLAYRHSVETTIYLTEAAQRKGFGRALYSALLDCLRERPVHTALGGIALPNAASVALHEKCGFRKVAHLDQVGFKFGRWIDVGYWQIVLGVNGGHDR
jgi:L-amino acid N-acyltransferase YncA